MITYQDLEKCENPAKFLLDAIAEYKGGTQYRTAVDADTYDRRQNSTIMNYVHTIMSRTGVPMIDITASNNKIVSGFFPRLNTQRNTYSLGNGVTFAKAGLKEKLGADFDTKLKKAAYFALIHGVSYCFWSLNRMHVFKATEFVPFWDEDSGALRAGARFWRISPDKPMYVVLYEEDGFTKYRAANKSSALSVIDEKKTYKQKVVFSPADGEEIVGGDNYSALPIVPLWGSDLHQSTLVGMKCSIDSYDLIRSGFANDLSDCAQIYWILKNCGGMNDEELSRFRENLLFRHIAHVDGDSGAEATPYTQEIPAQARSTYLTLIRSGIYEDFGGLDVHAIAAGATNDHIDAAYQPLDENADDYEYQIIECVQQLLALQGVAGDDAIPQFKRNRISNQKEQVEMVAMEAPYLDDETILNKLPNVTPDEVEAILKKKDAEDLKKVGLEE